MKSKTIFLFVTLAIAQTATAQMPNRPPQGSTEVKLMTSEILGVERGYSIYLPKSYTVDEERTYPVLYLLHGVFGDHTNWVERGHIQDVANRLIDGDKAVEMIIVMPDAGTEWDGYFNMNGWAYEDYFFEELMPYIEENYRVKTGKENTAIAGLSMGGGGATVYGQKHPDKFSTVYAMSALMTLGEGEGLNQDDPKFRELNRTVREESAVNFVANADEKTVEELKSVRWFVDCGDDDFLFGANIAFVEEMREKRIPLQFRVRDGGHDWEYWHSALYIALPYVSYGFMNN